MSGEVESRILIPFPCCCPVHWGMKSHRLILSHIHIYFLSSEVYASNIPWPLSSSEVSHFIDFVLFLTSCSVHLMMYSWWCLQNHREGTAIQCYELSLAPASRGHCCSINFSKRLSFGICCGSLAWWFIEFWTICYTHKRAYFVEEWKLLRL